MDADKLKQMYSLNDKAYAKLKAEAMQMESFKE